MSKPIKLEGKNAGEKLQHVEMILNRLARKTVSHTGVYYPPVILSEYITEPDSNGVILRYMFPVRGVINQVFIAIDQTPKGMYNIDSELLIEGIKTANKQYISLRVPMTIFRESVAVNAGDKMTLKLKRKDLDIKGFWFAAKVDIAPEDRMVKKIAIDAIEEHYESYIKNAEDDPGIEDQSNKSKKLSSATGSTKATSKSSGAGTSKRTN